VMRTALIGYTGFVGSHLHRMYPDADVYNSSNIKDIRNQEYDLILNAGVPAVKWWANKNPAEDAKNIGMLYAHLATVKPTVYSDDVKVVHISTTDVYSTGQKIRAPYEGIYSGNVESFSINRTALRVNCPYGFNRLILEDKIKAKFPNHYIIRLPALFGDGLKKNVLYDLLFDNKEQYEKVSALSEFQWFDIDDLSLFIEEVFKSHIRVLNVSPEPISMRDLTKELFPNVILRSDIEPIFYNMFSEQTAVDNESYHYTVEAVMEKLRSYVDRVKERGVA
jgi:dTDP-4-dehydrorhamnose reductase